MQRKGAFLQKDDSFSSWDKVELIIPVLVIWDDIASRKRYEMAAEYLDAITAPTETQVKSIKRVRFFLHLSKEEGARL
uniref:Uncharacterized protein n=1 Tax=Thermosporothrix sp. COM3 TaxID=2490863 RepID=A0A455SQG6_9CHLR|nr:hypothetical protein KTC_47010 [Thermosporothrix sp. COM3]